MDAAAEFLGENQRGPGLAAGYVQYSRLRPQSQVQTDEPDLLDARRILEIVVSLDELVPGRHREEAIAAAPLCRHQGGSREGACRRVGSTVLSDPRLRGIG